MTNVELDFHIVTCNLGPGGARWKTPSLPPGDAVAYGHAQLPMYRVTIPWTTP
jgi:hypothetical protein